MALSTDPEKRARQLAGLQKGRETLAKRILGINDEPTAKAPAKASPGAKRTPAAKAAKAPAKADPASSPGDDEPIRYPKKGARNGTTQKPQQSEPEQRPRTGSQPRRRGFLDGFLGRY